MAYAMIMNDNLPTREVSSPSRVDDELFVIDLHRKCSIPLLNGWIFVQDIEKYDADSHTHFMPYGPNSLHFAIYLGADNTSIADIIKETKADINGTAHREGTPLHCACAVYEYSKARDGNKNPQLDVLSDLISDLAFSGGFWGALDNDGRTPFSYLSSGSFFDIFTQREEFLGFYQFLVRNNIPRGSTFRGHDEQLIRRFTMIENCRKLATPVSGGYFTCYGDYYQKKTLMSYLSEDVAGAIYAGCPVDTVRELLMMGADVNQQGCFSKKYPLYAACAAYAYNKLNEQPLQEIREIIRILVEQEGNFYLGNGNPEDGSMLYPSSYLTREDLATILA
jgi:hypothetical protein